MLEPEAPTRRNELATRVISGAVLGVVALAAELIGGLPFALLVALIAALAFRELTGMAGADDPAWPRLLTGLGLVAGLIVLQAGSDDWAGALIVIPAALALAAGIEERRFRWIGTALIYVGVPCAGLIVLRQASPHGWAAVLYVLLVVWATDIAAYFGGRGFGGPKLWPKVSPKKTWSGALSGLVAAVAAGGAAAGLTVDGHMRAGLALAVPLSIAAQAGDLLESSAKRHFGVKDSGSIIPGHGGVLDRVDGLFGAAALAWLLALVGLGGGLLVRPGGPLFGGAS